MGMFSDKIKEVVASVAPIISIVFLLHFTMVPIPSSMISMFIIGSIAVIVGLTLFLIGVDLGMEPLGMILGTIITRKNKVWIVIIVGLILGFFISFAEPDLMILANQIEDITSGAIASRTIMMTVSSGIAIMLVVGFLRIFYNVPVHYILIISYTIVFGLALFTPPEFFAIAFDASGATTGILSVPFILALSLGITNIKKTTSDKDEEGFGMIGITSVGAILAIILLGIFIGGEGFSGSLDLGSYEGISNMAYWKSLVPHAIQDSVSSIAPLVVILVVVSIVYDFVTKRESRKIFFGLCYVFVGFFLFFMGVNFGFMRIGQYLGIELATNYSTGIIVAVGFFIGMVTILAEPAVHVLTHQIETVTAGYVKRRSVLFSLTIGVGIAVAFSILRIAVPGIQLWHYLVPGYLISLGLTFTVPNLFVGIAFDAGGVATGPMTATFILALTHGAASAIPTADLMADGFGMIAMVAMMPIITLQLQGLLFKIKTRKKGVS